MDWKSKWPWFLVFAVLCVVGIAGTIYGITQSGNEPGFNGEPPWEPGDFPLTVCSTRYAEGINSVAPVEYAIGTWNRDVDLLLFTWAPLDVPCDVEVTLGAPADVHEDNTTEPGGAMRFVERGDRLVCEVSTINVTGARESLVVTHELGHCLGLAHDTSRESMMARTQLEEEPEPGELRITDHDRTVLSNAYRTR